MRYFVQKFTRKMSKTIDTITCETMEALLKYRWPGNIRELENLIERAVILSPGTELRVPIRDLQTRIAFGQNHERSQTLEDVERKHILTTLRSAARQLL